VIDLVRQARAVQDFMEGRGWSFCFIGGVALVRWGEPRATVDVDLSLFTDFGTEAPFVDDLLSHFAPRIPNAREFALENRVLLLYTPAGDGLDVALAGLPFEWDMIARSSEHEYLPGLLLRTCSAEDLIVMKAFAARDRDWADVQGITTRQVGRLDWAAIFERLAPLVELKEAPEIITKLRAIQGASAE
jgi:hypothetical protein